MEITAKRNGYTAIVRGLKLAAAFCLSFPIATASGENLSDISQERCGLELVLAVDVSGSIDHYDFGIQMKGYAQAFRDKDVLQAVSTLGDGGLDVTLVQWSSVTEQVQTLTWSHVSGPDSAEQFAAAIEDTRRSFVQTGTGIGSAIAYAARLIETRPRRCKRSVIDVSGDGRNNVGLEPALVRDLAVSSGITINGLAIRDTDALLHLYYEEHVIGGKGAFVITADSYIDIAETIKKKLIRELSPHTAALPQTKAIQ